MSDYPLQVKNWPQKFIWSFFIGIFVLVLASVVDLDAKSDTDFAPTFGALLWALGGTMIGLLLGYLFVIPRSAAKADTNASIRPSTNLEKARRSSVLARHGADEIPNRANLPFPLHICYTL